MAHPIFTGQLAWAHLWLSLNFVQRSCDFCRLWLRVVEGITGRHLVLKWIKSSPFQCCCRINLRLCWHHGTGWGNLDVVVGTEVLTEVHRCAHLGAEPDQAILTQAVGNLSCCAAVTRLKDVICLWGLVTQKVDVGSLEPAESLVVCNVELWVS